MSQATTARTVKRTQKKAPHPPHDQAGEGRSVPVPVPEVHVHQVRLPAVGVPHVPVPDLVRHAVPGRRASRVLWFGGLAGLAAVGVIGWPVAGVVAVGTYAAERWARAGLREELSTAEKS